MLDFYSIAIEDKDWITEALKYSDFQGCEYSFANNLAWCRAGNSKIARFQNFYIICAFGNNDSPPLFTFPSGNGDYKALLDEMEKTANSLNQPLIIRGVTDKTMKILNETVPDKFYYKEETDDSDYIYNTSDLVTFSGKKYHKKRNHLVQFRRNYNALFSEMTESDFNDCIELSVSLYHDKDGYNDRSQIMEQYAINVFFNNFYKLGLNGGVLRIDGKLIAFSIGEKLNSNTFVTHIEKADTKYHGAYTAIVQEFTSNIARDYQYINREEDLGIEGLRKSKQSYYPAYMLKKYTAFLK